ncbi:receptor-like protein 46 [Telopea speciosissima]|uniref:receptor-like protein 46 n=1 Tax=Telopea speciosissima TaxID=54955 RepID=UPI001CC4229D|nr:receptor-like protein 46 [Telopea speciosissima]
MEIPAGIGELSNLSTLSLNMNRLVGGIPSTIQKLSKLKTLQLDNNLLSGVIPPWLFDIKSLENLGLGGNNLTWYNTVKIAPNCMLSSLSLKSCRLAGSIPDWLATQKSLIFLDLSENEIEGTIQVNWKTFEELIVNWKKSVQGLSSLNLDIYCLMDLSMNQLSGEIPDSIGELKGLKSLSFSYNQLTGMIPKSLGDLESTEMLDLSHNKLSGEIPPSFAKLQQLTVLDLSNNKLKGPIPRGRQMDTMDNPSYYANNSGLCGMQIKVPCSISPPEYEHEHLPKKNSQQRKSEEEKWFVLEGAGIGFSIGFVSTIVTIYVAGYFDHSTPRRHHGYRCRRQG